MVYVASAGQFYSDGTAGDACGNVGSLAGYGAGFLLLVCFGLDFAPAIRGPSKGAPIGVGAKIGVAMSFESLERFLEMGGYAMYVFGSYGITAIVMVGLVVTALKQHRAFFEKRRSAGPDAADTTKGTRL